MISLSSKLKHVRGRRASQMNKRRPLKRQGMQSMVHFCLYVFHIQYFGGGAYSRRLRIKDPLLHLFTCVNWSMYTRESIQRIIALEQL